MKMYESGMHNYVGSSSVSAGDMKYQHWLEMNNSVNMTGQ